LRAHGHEFVVQLGNALKPRLGLLLGIDDACPVAIGGKPYCSAARALLRVACIALGNDEWTGG
jgi:hypothetical protein